MMKLGVVDGDIVTRLLPYCSLDNEPPVLTQAHKHPALDQHLTFKEFFRFSKSFFICMSIFE